MIEVLQGTWLLWLFVVAVFGAGISIERFRKGHVTEKILNEKTGELREEFKEHLVVCQKQQGMAIANIKGRVEEIHAERKDIWDIVRGTKEDTKVMRETLFWIVRTMDEKKAEELKKATEQKKMDEPK